MKVNNGKFYLLSRSGYFVTVVYLRAFTSVIFKICERLPLLSITLNGTPLIRSPMRQTKNWPYEQGGGIIGADLNAVMTNTPYIEFAFLEQLFSLINNRNEDIAYSN